MIESSLWRMGNINALAVDKDKNVHMVYDYIEPNETRLRYARNVGGLSWSVYTLDTGRSTTSPDEKVGRYPSLHVTPTGVHTDCLGDRSVLYCRVAASPELHILEGAGILKMFTGISVGADDMIHLTWFANLNIHYTNLSGDDWSGAVTLNTRTTIFGPHCLAADSENNLHLVYYDSRDRNLKYRENASGTWRTLEPVDSSANQAVGMHHSLAVDKNGTPHVCYSYGTQLKYANNANGQWNTYLVSEERTDDNGIALFEPEDTTKSMSIHISYYQVELDAIHLRYAWQDLSSLDSNWNDLPIYPASPEYPIGQNSITVDKKGKVHISYYEPAVRDLYYATDALGSWRFFPLDSIGDVGLYNAIGRDVTNQVIVAYYDATNADLKLAVIRNESSGN